MQNNKIFLKLMRCILVYTTFIAKIIPQMKHLFCICFLLASNLHAQDVFNRYATHAEVTHLNVSPQMFQLLSKFKVNTSDPESQLFIGYDSIFASFSNDEYTRMRKFRRPWKWLKAEISQTALDLCFKYNGKREFKVQFAAVYGEGEVR